MCPQCHSIIKSYVYIGTLHENTYLYIYRVRHNYGNTHFIIVLDKTQSNLKFSWICINMYFHEEFQCIRNFLLYYGIADTYVLIEKRYVWPKGPEHASLVYKATDP